MQDWRLLRQYVEGGSEAAFAKLVEQHLKAVYATCLREVRDPHLAEDVTQAVFLVLARRASTIRAGTPLAGWLFNTSRFVSKNALRQEARRRAIERKAAEEMPVTDAANDANWNEIDPVLNDAMASLKAHDRDIILLRFYHDLSMAEAGESLGISEDAAKMRTSRALARLRQALTKSGVAVPAVGGLAALLTAHAAEAIPAAIGASLTAALSTITVGGLAPVGAGITIITEGAIRAMWITKVKAAAAIAGACLIGGSVVGVVAHSYGAGSTSKARVRSVSNLSTAGAVPAVTGTWRERGDPAAVQLLDQMTAAYKALKSFSATVEIRQGMGSATPSQLVAHASIAFVRPNKVAIRPVGQPDATPIPDYKPTQQTVYDGTHFYTQAFGGKKEYVLRDTPDNPLKEAFAFSGMGILILSNLLTDADPWSNMFEGNSPREVATLDSMTVGAEANIDGVEVNTVTAVISGSGGGQHFQTTVTLSIGKADHLLRQTALRGTGGGMTVTQVENHLNVKVNPTLPDSELVFHPNPGDTMVDETRKAPTRRLVQAVPDVPDSMTRAGTAVLSGRVVFEDGKPASGIKVVAQLQNQAMTQLESDQHGRISKRMGQMTWAEDISGADGTYHLPHLTNLAYNVAIMDPSDEWVAAAVEGVTGAEGKTVAVPDLVVTKGGIITGVVTDKATGKPIPEIYVQCYGPDRPNTSAMCLAVKVDASGRYHMRVSPGRIRIYADGITHVIQETYVDVMKDQTVTVNFELAPKGTF